MMSHYVLGTKGAVTGVAVKGRKKVLLKRE
jgi:hypothetical protein